MLVGCSLAFDFPLAKVTIKIVDEGGNPIDAAKASISFELPKGSEQGIRDVAEKGVTGADGVFSASSRTGTLIAYSAEKQGYYKSYGEYHFATSANGRWQPWNPEFKLVLRKIENPVPMYARDTKMSPISLLEANKGVGFDFIEYDWIAPYGKGKHADLIFKTNVNYNNENDYNYTLTVTFPNKFDGIQLVKEDLRFGSQFKLPRIAPSSGYKSELIRSRVKLPNESIKDDYMVDNNYIFRIRSEEQNGKLIRAMYGKIQGDIRFSIKITGKASILFKYYLNPDYSTNLEFHPKQNLFTNLDSTEQVGL
jgi:hypothetical protein